MPRSTRRPRPCRNCQQFCTPPPWWEGRCAACHTHWRRFGVERPRDARRGGTTHLVRCRGCRQPTRPRELTLGRCPACYAYWQAHGVERPVERRGRPGADSAPRRSRQSSRD